MRTKRHTDILLTTITALLIFACDSKQEVFYPSGQLKQVFPMKGGKVDGLVIDYYENGVIKSEVEFVEGQQDGLAKFYYETGELRKETRFKGEVEMDSSLIYYKGGSLAQKCFFKNGKIHDTLYQYFETGTVKMKGKKEDGVKVGSWSFMDSLGKINRVIFYRSDTIQSVREKTTYRNLLSGFEILVPDNMVKIMEVRNSATFLAAVDDLGAVSYSMGSNIFTETNLNDQVDKDLKTAKINFPKFEVTKRTQLESNIIEVECRGRQNKELKNEEFIGKILYIKNSDKFIVIVVYIPNRANDRQKEIQKYFDGVLKTIKILPPETIIES